MVCYFTTFSYCRLTTTSFQASTVLGCLKHFVSLLTHTCKFAAEHPRSRVEVPFSNGVRVEFQIAVAVE